MLLLQGLVCSDVNPLMQQHLYVSRLQVLYHVLYHVWYHVLYYVLYHVLQLLPFISSCTNHCSCVAFYSVCFTRLQVLYHVM